MNALSFSPLSRAFLAQFSTNMKIVLGEMAGTAEALRPPINGGAYARSIHGLVSRAGLFQLNHVKIIQSLTLPGHIH